jgi:hypothetical protein
MHLAPSGAYTRCPLIRGRFTPDFAVSSGEPDA